MPGPDPVVVRRWKDHYGLTANPDDLYVEARVVDQERARTEIERFVYRAEHGDLAYWWGLTPQTTTTPFPEDLDWEPESGYAPIAGSPAQSPSSSSSTTPTGQGGAIQPSASTGSVSSIRRETVSDQYIQRAANALPNGKENPVSMTVEAIMAERNVGRRHAYSILRQMKEEEIGQEPVPTNQRERVLTTLYRLNIRDSRELVDALQSGDYAIDGHDASKVLWSLQKTGHVKFRERQNPRFLYAIELTPRGRIEARELSAPKPVEAEPVEAAVPPEYAAVIENARALQQEINELTAPEEQITVDDISGAEQEVAEIAMPWDDDMARWPAFREVRDRALKAAKLDAAAELLREAGEDDIALTLMVKTEFTPLEKEVVVMLKLFGEV